MNATVKQRPLLVTGELVQPIIKDQKTNTRRLNGLEAANVMVAGGWFTGAPRTYVKDGNFWAEWTLDDDGIERVHAYKCPYGQVGDQLWGREAWRVGKPHDQKKPSDILPSLIDRGLGKGVTVLYEAGGWKSVGLAGRVEPIYCNSQQMPPWAGKRRPGMFMPREFSRILLEITEIRIERLQAISSADIVAEGVRVPTSAETGCALVDISTPDGPGAFLTREQFGDVDALLRAHWAALWCKLNGRASWDENPYVWVIVFKRIEPIDAE